MIFVWIGLGWALRRAGARPRDLGLLNTFIIWIPLPAMILAAIHGLTWRTEYWAPVSMAWIVFAAAAAFFVMMGRLLKWKRETVGALLLTGGLGNTSFVGYPLIRALYGEKALAIAVLNDQPGTFLVLSTLGVAAAAYFSSGRLTTRFLKFPPLWALVAAAALNNVALPDAVYYVSRLLIPLALISVGAQLKPGRWRRELSWGLAYKLVLAPALIALLFGLRGEAAQVTVLEAGMGPMITGAIVASENGLDPELCSLMVGVGVPLSLILVPLWAKLIALTGQ